MSISAVGSQPIQFSRPQSSGSTNEASESKATESGETSAQESAEGGSSVKASPPPGTAQIFDIQA